MKQLNSRKIVTTILWTTCIYISTVIIAIVFAGARCGLIDRTGFDVSAGDYYGNTFLHERFSPPASIMCSKYDLSVIFDILQTLTILQHFFVGLFITYVLIFQFLYEHLLVSMVLFGLCYANIIQ